MARPLLIQAQASRINIMHHTQEHQSGNTLASSVPPATRSRIFLDELLPDQQYASGDKLYRGRILVGIILSYSCFLFLGALYFYYLTDLTAQVKYQTLIALLPLCLFFLSLLYLYNKTAAFSLCANLVVASTYLGVNTGIFTTGGPFISPATAVVPVPALLAFCMCGRSNGYLWATIVLLSHILLMTMAVYNYPFDNVLADDHSYTHIVFDWLIAYSAMITTVALYEHMQARLKEERDHEHRKYVHLATHDQLTNLPNRVLFYERIQQAISQSQQKQAETQQASTFGLLYLDLDDFKPINDQYGHAAGDMLLKETARRLRFCVRSSDTIARLGGDEFAIIIKDISQAAIADEIASKISTAICQPVAIADTQVTVKISLGLAFYPQDGQSADQLLRCADAAMYRAKKDPDRRKQS